MCLWPTSLAPATRRGAAPLTAPVARPDVEGLSRQELLRLVDDLQGQLIKAGNKLAAVEEAFNHHDQHCADCVCDHESGKLADRQRLIGLPSKEENNHA